jgi:hypothetical protein
MGRLVHTVLGSSSLVAHVLQYPPPPPRKQLCTRSCSNKHTHTGEAKLAEEKRVRDEALAEHVRRTGGLAGFQEPAAAPQGLVDVPDVVLAVEKAESRWHKQIPATLDQHYKGGLKRPGGVKSKKFAASAQEAVEKGLRDGGSQRSTKVKGAKP